MDRHTHTQSPINAHTHAHSWTHSYTHTYLVHGNVYKVKHMTISPHAIIWDARFWICIQCKGNLERSTNLNVI